MKHKIIAGNVPLNGKYTLYNNPLLRNTIIVKSNIDIGKIITMTVKELSEFTPEEAPLVIQLLEDWKASANGFAHESCIDAYIEIVKGNPVPDNYIFSKVYFAISLASDNGTKQIGLEGFVEFESTDQEIAVSCWENHPHNLDLDISRWRLFNRPITEKPVKDSRHFLGVGRQLLWHSIQREMQVTENSNLVFYIGAIKELKEEGIDIQGVPSGFRSKSFTKNETEQLLADKSAKTLQKLQNLTTPIPAELHKTLFP